MVFNHCSFVHEGRLSNMEAHHLAKQTLTLMEGRHIWLLNPHDFDVTLVQLAFD